MGMVKGKRVSGVLTQLGRDDEGQKNTVVGFDDISRKIIDKLVGVSPVRQVIPIVGMGGIGKTTLTKSICAQRVIKQQFDVCAWAAISQEYNILKILNQLLPEKMRDYLSEMSESELGEKLHRHLSGRRYLIVLDDMWSIDVWYKIKFFFPDSGNYSRIVVTTRLSELGSQLASNSLYVFDMKFLDETSSWNLFSKIVFGEKGCPLELVEIGKNIANNCKGLPLSIVVIGGFLAKSHHTQEYWESIRDNLNSIVNSDNDEYCLKLLKMSYTQLPAHLKPCFLYMGVFEEDSSIRVPTLVKLWAAEGFLKPITGKSLETVAKEYLKDLIDRNLILVDDLGLTGDVKYCKIHDLLRDLSLKEADKERFYHVIRQQSPHQRINKENQRCIVIPKSSGKDENDVDAFESMSLARSFICDNAEVQLPCSNYRLLRVLKAYEKYSERRDGYFLKNMFQSSVNLRYLAIAPHDKSKFPSSVNLLWNLQTLIVDLSGEVVAPVEIWNMPQLRHVEFLSKGLYLPDPPNNNILVIMENLETLTGVKNLKLSEEVVGRIPNIKKLGISYDDRAKLWPSSYYRLCNLERLQKLESFECRIETGRFLRKVKFPNSLKKMTLETDRMEWEETLKEIGSLPHLQKLELYFGSFRKRKWRTVEGHFRSLKFLRLFGCRCLKYWRMKRSHFPRLEHLVLAHLKDLEKIPSEIGNIPTLKSISMSKCKESAVESAKEIVKKQEFNYGEPSVEVRVTLWGKDQLLERLASPPYFHVEVI